MSCHFHYKSGSRSNGNEQTVASIVNGGINQMAFCKPAIIFFYGVQKAMKLGSQLVPLVATADGVFDCLWILVEKPGETASVLIHTYPVKIAHWI